MPITPQEFVSKWKRARSRPIRNNSLTCATWWYTKRRTITIPQAPASGLKWTQPNQRRTGLGGCCPAALFRLGIQRQGCRSRQSLKPAPALPRCLREPARIGRLGYQPPCHPHELHQPPPKLDQAVFAAYGWKSDLSNEEILEKRLALNLERAKR